MRTRARAASYGASRACQAVHDARSADQRGLRIALCQEHCPVRPRGHRGQQRGADLVRDPRHLVRCQPRRVRRPGGQHDLDERPEQPRSGEVVRGLVGRAANDGGGDVGPALGQPQQRNPGLRTPTQPARPTIRRLGLRELPAQPVELAGVVDRLAEDRIGLRLR